MVESEVLITGVVGLDEVGVEVDVDVVVIVDVDVLVLDELVPL